MEVYTIDDENLTEIPERPVDYEQDLQSHLLKATGAKIGGLRMMYVSQEGTADEEGGYFDILALDDNGDTVIVELKRGKTPRQVVSQALEYASGIRNEPYDRLEERFEAFRRHSGEDSLGSLREEHAAFFKIDDDPLDEDDFNDDIHLVIVAAEFGDATLNMADLLRDHGLDVVCVRYQTFTDADTGTRLLTTESVRRPLAMEPPPPGEDALTETEQLQEEFWSQLVEKLDAETDSAYYTDSAKPRSYLPVKGTLPDDVNIALGTDSLRGQIQVKLHLRDDESHMYDYLLKDRTNLEEKIDPTPDEQLIWDADSARYEQIRLVRDGDITEDRDEWDEMQQWLLDRWVEMDEKFSLHLEQVD